MGEKLTVMVLEKDQSLGPIAEGSGRETEFTETVERLLKISRSDRRLLGHMKWTVSCGWMMMKCTVWKWRS